MNSKQAILILSILASLACETAFGFVRIGWDRPIFRADLTVLSQEGIAPETLAGAKTVELVMTQQDGSPSPMGFVLLIDGQFKQAYQVKSVSTDACKQTVFTIIPVQTDNDYRMDSVFETIQVVDRSSGTCLDYSKYGWEMEMKTVNLFHAVTGEIQLAGTPESVITPQ